MGGNVAKSTKTAAAAVAEGEEEGTPSKKRSKTEMGVEWVHVVCTSYLHTYPPTHLPTYLPTYLPTRPPTYLTYLPT